MEIIDLIQQKLNFIVWSLGIPVGDQTIPFMILLLLGSGIFVTFRLFFVQIKWFKHGIDVIMGKYDDPEHEGDINHFQALTTALSATVGIGNIAGVATAIHYGGPGALFWMWMTAFFGMALKYAECTLAMKYRGFDKDGNASGGPMYYIEKGLGEKFKWMAIFFAVCTVMASFGTGNSIQAFTVADSFKADFGMSTVLTGLILAFLVGIVIIGGIQRIGSVTSKLAPFMAASYCLASVIILILAWDKIPEAFRLIFSSAFNPTSQLTGIAGGGFLVTLLWGVKRGLFSNEAGQGSAPIAHAAAKTDEPAREGVVAMLGPFIDTLVICTMTGLIIVVNSVNIATAPTKIELNDTNISYALHVAEGERILNKKVETPDNYEVKNGVADHKKVPSLAYYDVIVSPLYIDKEQKTLFTGTIKIKENTAVSSDGKKYSVLYGDGVRNGSTLTALSFSKGLEPIGLAAFGGFLVTIAVFLFAVSTAISWSYYGDRSIQYLFGAKYVPAYKWVYIIVVFLGANVSLEVVWGYGDAALGLMAIPNLLAILMLSGRTKEITSEYTEKMAVLKENTAS